MNSFTQNLTVLERKNHICFGVNKQNSDFNSWTLRVLSAARENRFFVIICFIQHAALVRLSKQIHWIKVI